MTDEPENTEVFIRAGEVWVPDGKALCEKLGALYLYCDEDGELWACVPGRGDDLVRDLLCDKPATSNATLSIVKPIK